MIDRDWKELLEKVAPFSFYNVTYIVRNNKLNKLKYGKY